MTKEFYDYNDIIELRNTVFEFSVIDGKKRVVAVIKSDGQKIVVDDVDSCKDDKKGIDLND